MCKGTKNLQSNSNFVKKVEAERFNTVSYFDDYNNCHNVT